MGLLSRAGDTFFALRFLRLLTTPWEKTGAYKNGIIDANGQVIKKPKTSAEKSTYNLFHKLVFNLKRLLNRIPFGKTTIASYATALLLIKEHTGLSERLLGTLLEDVTGYNPYIDLDLNEEYSLFLTEHGELKKGEYELIESVLLPNGDYTNLKGSVIFTEDAQPIGSIFGISIFKGTHVSTKQPVLLTTNSLDIYG